MSIPADSSGGRSPRRTRMPLLKDINQQLSAQGQRLVRCIGDAHAWHQLGDWYLLDLKTDSIIATHLDLKEFAGSLELASK
jgi:hypothetical protein